MGEDGWVEEEDKNVDVKKESENVKGTKEEEAADKKATRTPTNRVVNNHSQPNLRATKEGHAGEEHSPSNIRYGRKHERQSPDSSQRVKNRHW